MHFCIVSWLLGTTLLDHAAALYTPKGSPCAVDCATKNANFTGTGDLVCLDTAYTDTSKGITLKSCISCLSTSDYVNDAQPDNGNSDMWWYLWHIKYVQQYCLIDTPQTSAASTCASMCTPMSDTLDNSWLYHGAQPQYGICSWNESQYMDNAQNCASCLLEQEGGVIIGNMADTLYGACQSQPFAKDGGVVKTARDLFDSSTLGPSATSAAPTSSSESQSVSMTGSESATSSETTATSSNAISGTTSSGSIVATSVVSGAGTTRTVVAASTTAGAASASATQTTESKAGNGQSGLTTGAATGIGIGLGIAALLGLIVALVFLLIRKRRKEAVARRTNMNIDDKTELWKPRSSDAMIGPPQYDMHELADQSHPSQRGLAEKYGNNILEAEARSPVILHEMDGYSRR